MSFIKSTDKTMQKTGGPINSVVHPTFTLYLVGVRWCIGIMKLKKT